MSEMKKLYADGQFVCEYESTGDYAKDIEICQDMLRKRGLLHNKPTVEQAIFRQAVSFATASSYLYNRDLATVPTKNGMSAVPFVVNAAFALELYLKTMGHLFGSAQRGHDLLELFDALPPEGHEVLRQNLPKAKWQCGITNMEGFRKVLSDLRNAFIEWRYLHETDRTSEISFIPTIFVTEVLHAACQANEKVHRASKNP
jgi:hypothetical protein